MLRQKVVRVRDRRKDAQSLLVVVVVRRRKWRILRRRLRGLGGSVRQSIVLLPFHAPVLEPDLDLPLGEAELVCHFDAPAPGEVPVVVKFLFELEGLMPRVRGPRPLSVDAICSVCTDTFSNITIRERCKEKYSVQ